MNSSFSWLANLARALCITAIGMASGCLVAGAQSGCNFVGGFASLHAQLTTTIGDCTDNQTYSADGDALQHTTHGLLVWRKFDNFTEFTNGSTTWVNGPFGLLSRPSNDRFGWEGSLIPTTPEPGGLGSWNPTAPVPNALHLLGAPQMLGAPADGTYAVLVGSIQSTFQDVSVVYDTTSQTWSAPVSLGVDGDSGLDGLFPLGGGKVLALTDRPGKGGQITEHSTIYDLATNSWTPAAPIPIGRRFGIAVRLTDGRILVAGGQANTGRGDPTTSAFIYDPAAGAWSQTGSMAQSMMMAASTVLQDGQVLVTGGEPGDSTTPSAGAEIYNPQSGSWAPTAMMAYARLGHSSLLLPSGKVLVAGGGGTELILAESEIYDPSANTWTPVRFDGDGPLQLCGGVVT